MWSDLLYRIRALLRRGVVEREPVRRCADTDASDAISSRVEQIHLIAAGAQPNAAAGVRTNLQVCRGIRAEPGGEERRPRGSEIRRLDEDH